MAGFESSLRDSPRPSARRPIANSRGFIRHGSPGLPVRRARIWIDRETVLPRKIEVDERVLVRTITFSRLRTNSTIPPGTFTFRVPDGVRVIEQ
jgi:hypothetical protein